MYPIFVFIFGSLTNLMFLWLIFNLARYTFFSFSFKLLQEVTFKPQIPSSDGLHIKIAELTHKTKQNCSTIN